MVGFANNTQDEFITLSLHSDKMIFHIYKRIILKLAINDANKRDFDYLGFATICFQLQQYEVLLKQFNKN